MSAAVTTESTIVLRSPNELLPHQCSICRKRIVAYTVAIVRQALRNKKTAGLRPAFVPAHRSFEKFDATLVAPFIEDLRSRIEPGEDEQVWS